jgi:hypothetical protein
LLPSHRDPTTQTYPITSLPIRELQLGEAVGPTILICSSSTGVLPHHTKLARAATRQSGRHCRIDAAATTKSGLKVESACDTKSYEKGIKVSDAEMQSLKIRGDKFTS